MQIEKFLTIDDDLEKSVTLSRIYWKQYRQKKKFVGEELKRNTLNVN